MAGRKLRNAYKNIFIRCTFHSETLINTVSGQYLSICACDIWSTLSLANSAAGKVTLCFQPPFGVAYFQVKIVCELYFDVSSQYQTKDFVDPSKYKHSYSLSYLHFFTSLQTKPACLDESHSSNWDTGSAKGWARHLQGLTWELIDQRRGHT